MRKIHNNPQPYGGGDANTHTLYVQTKQLLQKMLSKSDKIKEHARECIMDDWDTNVVSYVKNSYEHAQPVFRLRRSRSVVELGAEVTDSWFSEKVYNKHPGAAVLYRYV
jgi:hypothetical protein